MSEIQSFKKGDRVRVIDCPADKDAVGKLGFVTNSVTGINPVLRVRLEGGTDKEYQEIDGTAEKFERLSPPEPST